MKHRSILQSAAVALLISGCIAKAPTDEQSQTASANAEKNEQAIKPEVTTATVPDGKSVLTDIYKQPVEEVTGSQLSDGRYVSYWNGYQFTLDGKHYYVAFSEATPESEIEYPAPEDMATISQATYELISNEWKLKAVQHDIGKFGCNNKAPAVDTLQKTTAFSGSHGKFVLATPAVIFANAGIQLFFYEIFAFSPSDTQWKYVGYVNAGSENSGGCSHEADSVLETKCVKSTGSLKFSDAEDSAMPLLKVVLQGTELDEAGNVITLTDKNSITYRYDDGSSKYLPINEYLENHLSLSRK